MFQDQFFLIFAPKLLRLTCGYVSMILIFCFVAPSFIYLDRHICIEKVQIEIFYSSFQDEVWELSIIQIFWKNPYPFMGFQNSLILGNFLRFFSSTSPKENRFCGQIVIFHRFILVVHIFCLTFQNQRNPKSDKQELKATKQLSSH